MNWDIFQTYNLSFEQSFEMLCDQLFERWCKREYDSNISSFDVINGSGGDGGVESYVTLSDDCIIGLQAKWFITCIQAPQINQIKKSIQTALTIRPHIKRYIVCVPRNLASLTAKGKNTEKSRWDSLVSSIKMSYPDCTIELWDDYRITSEIQYPENVGIKRFWFEKSVITCENIADAYEIDKNSWLSTKYEPDLNVPGEIFDTLNDRIAGNISFRLNLREKFLSIIKLYNDLIKYLDEMLFVLNAPKNNDIFSKLKSDILQAKSLTDSICTYLTNETYNIPKVNYMEFYLDFNAVLDAIKKIDVSYNYYFHAKNIKDTISQLLAIDYRDLVKAHNDSLDNRPILFLGNPGTGKTQGVSSFVDSAIKVFYHIPILISAKEINPEQTWKDILINALRLNATWSEEEIWLALLSAANRNKFKEEYIDNEIKTTPKVVIIVDGIDESNDNEKWQNKLLESKVISSKYNQIRFIFTSRSIAFPKRLEGINTYKLNADGDISVDKLFDKYVEHYNINVQNKGWLKTSLSTPLALKWFCELNKNCTIDSSDESITSMESLWRRKIQQIDDDFSSKYNVSKKNQYAFNTVVLLAELFLGNDKIEYSNLINKIESEVHLKKELAEKIISIFCEYGLLQSFIVRGNGLDPDTYFYYSGIQSYYDYASSIYLIKAYGSPNKIDFNKHESMSRDALYSLSVISIQKYDYLIAQNPTIESVIREYDLDELVFYALQHSSCNTGKLFVEKASQIMKTGSQGIIDTLNNLIIPLARNTNHPLGASLLHNYLKSFDYPALRDMVWSIPNYLQFSEDEKWSNFSYIRLNRESNGLTKDDEYNGLPLIYAWLLSNLNNSIRKENRNELMRWALMTPYEYFKLFLEFSNINDPQIRSDLFSILMCVIYENDDESFIKEVSQWILKNILSPDYIDKNRDIAIRYYSIGIIKRAIELKIIDERSVSDHLPPYNLTNYDISLNKEALSGTRMGGYSAIDYDLARYVLIDHISYDFDAKIRKSDQFDKLLEAIAEHQPEYKGITTEQFILSAAYAFVLNMGWSKEEFFYLDNNDGKQKCGVDHAIVFTYPPATHGSRSDIMSICEKYVWQARKYIYGFLCDRLLFGDNHIKVTDYGKVEDFVIPIHDLKKPSLDNCNYWYNPEPQTVVVDKQTESKTDIVEIIKVLPNIDWVKWIEIDNKERHYEINDDSLLSLNSCSCFIGQSGIETVLFICSVIVTNQDLTSFLNKFRIMGNKNDRFLNPHDWVGGIDTSCYISPREVCWFSWADRYDSSNIEDIDLLTVHSAVDSCTYNDLENGDVSYDFPSSYIRKMLGIVDTDSTKYWDKDKTTKSLYIHIGENLGNYQDCVLVKKEEMMKKLQDANMSMVWIMRELRRESAITKEKYKDFYFDKDQYYIGYYKNEKFVVEHIKTEFQQSDISLIQSI